MRRAALVPLLLLLLAIPVGAAEGIMRARPLPRSRAEPEVYEQLDVLGARLAKGWTDALSAHGVAGSVARVGSILWVCLQEGETPRAFHRIQERGAELYGRLHRRVLHRSH